jgi:hypothetical protein
MSLIKLPPGMTPEQWAASPQAQNRPRDLARRPGRDYDPATGEILRDGQPTGMFPSPPPPPPAGGRRPVSQQPQLPPPTPLHPGRLPRPTIRPDGSRGPGFGKGPPIGPNLVPDWSKVPFDPSDPDNYWGGGKGPGTPYPPVAAPGQAQPKVDPAAAATRPQDSARNQIAAALREMFPEMDPGQIQVLSAQLAAEYQRERTAAVDSLRPEAPMAEPTEQMEFDEAYQGMRANERAEDRMRQRMEQQLRQEEAEQRRMEQTRQAAARRPLGHAGPQSSPQYSGPGKVGGGDWPAPVQPPRKITPPGVALPSPGMAQPVQDPYATPTPDLGQWYEKMVGDGMPPMEASNRVSTARYYADNWKMSDAEQEMYWELVLGGTSPSKAVSQAREYYRYRPS